MEHVIELTDKQVEMIKGSTEAAKEAQARAQLILMTIVAGSECEEVDGANFQFDAGKKTLTITAGEPEED